MTASKDPKKDAPVPAKKPKPTSTKTRVTKKEQPPPQDAPTEEKKTTQLTSLEFRKRITERYGLPAEQWWEAADKKSGRTTYILHLSGWRSIAAIEGLVFSEPIVHEAPGAILIYSPADQDLPAGSETPKLHSVLVLGDNGMTAQQPKSANSSRWAITGSCWLEDEDGMEVRGSRRYAEASASVGGGGDAAGYGSGFVAARNRLFSRLVSKFIGADAAGGIYSDVEANAFAEEANTCSPDEQPTKQAPQATAPTTSTQTTQPLPAAAQSTGGFAAPDMSKGTAPKANGPKPAAAPAAAPAAPAKAKAAPAAKAAEGFPTGSTEDRMKAIAELDPERRLAAVKHEIGGDTMANCGRAGCKAGVENIVHLGNLWKYLEPIAQSLGEKGRAACIAARDERRTTLISSGSFEEAGTVDEKSPQGVADGICGELHACESMEALGECWQNNLPVWRELPERLRKQITATKDQMKSRFAAS